MSKLSEYYHKKYYPDLTFEQVDAAINKDESTYNKAVKLVKEKHLIQILNFL
jgi:hypothetical protein